MKARSNPSPIKEGDIVYEDGEFWAAHEGPGLFRVYRSGATHATRVSTFHFKTDPDRAKARAIEDVKRRAAQAATERNHDHDDQA